MIYEYTLAYYRKKDEEKVTKKPIFESWWIFSGNIIICMIIEQRIWLHKITKSPRTF